MDCTFRRHIEELLELEIAPIIGDDAQWFVSDDGTFGDSFGRGG